VKIQTLQVPPIKRPATPAKLSHNNPSAYASPLGTPYPVQLKPALAEHERRRTQRVLLRVKANIHLAQQQGQAKSFEVATLSVNPHGAVIVMDQNLPIDTRVVLEHSGTKERIACKVARPAKQMTEGYHVPLEFDTPAPGFWKIDFPPSDWRPENQ
jgi:hypothetical protein